VDTVSAVVDDQRAQDPAGGAGGKLTLAAVLEAERWARTSARARCGLGDPPRDSLPTAAAAEEGQKEKL
jgi:1-deoxy-D-xylulose-5-phosphate reductoisomerase